MKRWVTLLTCARKKVLKSKTKKTKRKQKQKNGVMLWFHNLMWSLRFLRPAEAVFSQINKLGKSKKKKKNVIKNDGEEKGQDC